MVLLNPGPVTLTPRVRDALTRADWCHREPEFAELTQDINRRLVGVYPNLTESYAAVMMTGSGTSAVEGMLASFAPDTGGTLVLANGVYGERMAKMLTAHRKPHELQQGAWTEAVDVTAAAAILDRHPEITHIATVHHETTTGRLNDVDAIGALCRERGLALLLDGVSSYGAEAIDADAWNLEAVAATANKCLHGVPGLAFVVGHERLWTRTSAQIGSVYLDLYGYFAGQHGEGFSPFTQSVQVAFALSEALDELAEHGGWRARRQTYLDRAEAIHATLADCDVGMLLHEEESSSVLRSYLLPQGKTYDELHDALKTAGFVIYAGQGQLAPDIFRLAYMGDITAADVDGLCVALRTALA
ncbi:MAG: aminotransferase class V-fold PLP-dependent enzyme [Gammaproteobacteria bacterium]